ncbi:hypothetical protein ccbrp13_69400 [Ktedonobacteria bacterium brp13]|nr:hypothetical protein ccbrp13_69400 [Ktedonobacteria bacterium brp13]
MINEEFPLSFIHEATDINTSPDRLTELAQYYQLTPLVVANPATSAPILTQLSQNTDFAVRQAIAKNSNTPIDTLFILAQEFPAEFLDNPIISLVIMQPGSIKKIPPDSLMSLLRFEEIPLAWLQQIKNQSLYSWNPRLRDAAAMHVILYGEVNHGWQQQVAQAFEQHLRRIPHSKLIDTPCENSLFILFLLLFPQTVPMLQIQWDRFIATATPQEQQLVISSYNPIARRVLNKFAITPDAHIHAEAAHHLWMPLTILSQFSRQQQRKVRRSIATNPQLPSEKLQLLPEDVIETLLKDDSERVRAGLSSNASLPAYTATHLASDATNVRKALAANPRTPPALLATLLQTGSMEVWYGIAHNPRATTEQLAYLAHHGDEQVRSAVAAHKRTAVDILRTLSQEKCKGIWLGLTANPHTPIDVLAKAVEMQDHALWFRIYKHPVMLQHKHQPLIDLMQQRIRSLVRTNSLPAWYRKAFNQYYLTFPAAIVEEFTNSPFWEDRYLVTRHPKTSQKTLQSLTQDGHCYIRAAARTALNYYEQSNKKGSIVTTRTKWSQRLRAAAQRVFGSQQDM